jgi:hypothetical protein
MYKALRFQDHAEEDRPSESRSARKRSGVRVIRAFLKADFEKAL